MFNLLIDEREAELLKKSIRHCLDTCKDGGAGSGCDDCTSIERVLKRIP